MPAYVLIDAIVTDAKEYEAYKRLGDVAAAKHGGRFLARGGSIDVLEGDWRPQRIAMIEFPDRAAAIRWYHSAEYQEAKKKRLGAAEFRCVVTEGLEPKRRD